MQDWSQPSTDRTADDEADPARTAPDPPGASAAESGSPSAAESISGSTAPSAAESAAEESSDWDELTPASTGPVSVTPPNDVLVAGSPLAASAEPPAPYDRPYDSPSATPPMPYESGGGATGIAPDTSRAVTDEPVAGRDTGTAREGGEAVIDAATADRFHTRWHDVQFGFVDDPQDAVQRAGELATEVLRAFTDAINARKDELDDGWRPGGQPDTERLRLAVRGYREFVDRLLDT